MGGRETTTVTEVGFSSMKLNSKEFRTCIEDAAAGDHKDGRCQEGLESDFPINKDNEHSSHPAIFSYAALPNHLGMSSCGDRVCDLCLGYGTLANPALCLLCSRVHLLSVTASTSS